MDDVALREHLHEYINTADKEQLTAIYQLIEDDKTDIYDEATLQMLDARRDKHLKGLGRSYTADEFILMIREHLK